VALEPIIAHIFAAAWVSEGVRYASSGEHSRSEEEQP
jgi:hypothetical protein